MLKYAKLTFNKDKPWAYVIVKDYKAPGEESGYVTGCTGTLIYGSKRKYNDAGTWFIYGRADIVEALEEEWVVRNHFAGLL